MNWKPIILLTALGAGGYALYRYLSQQSELLKDYSVQPIAGKIISSTADLLVLDITMRFTNKSAIEGTITRLYSDIYINNIYAGNAVNQGNAVIPAKGQSDIVVRFTTAPKKFLTGIVNSLIVFLTSGDLPYRLKGYAKMKSGFLGGTLPFDVSGSLKKDLLGKTPVPVLNMNARLR